MDTYMHIDSLHKTLAGSTNGSMPGLFDIVGIGYHPPLQKHHPPLLC